MAAVTIEYGYIDFDGTTDWRAINLSEGFQHAPKITVTPIESSSAPDGSNVNLFIESVTNSGFTIRASYDFIGRVQYQALLTE